MKLALHNMMGSYHSSVFSGLYIYKAVYGQQCMDVCRLHTTEELMNNHVSIETIVKCLVELEFKPK